MKKPEEYSSLKIGKGRGKKRKWQVWGRGIGFLDGIE
jgi:hypothetical protein